MNYEFVAGDEIVIAPGRALKRIRAIAAIAAFGVTPGQLGGYVEKVENLSGDGASVRRWLDFLCVKGRHCKWHANRLQHNRQLT